MIDALLMDVCPSLPACRVGVCVPRECDAQDVLYGVLTPAQRHSILSYAGNIALALTGVCGEHYHRANAGTYAMSALILLLVVMAAAGTLLDLVGGGW